MHVKSFNIIDYPESERIIIESKVGKQVIHMYMRLCLYTTRELNYIYHHNK